MMNYWKRICVCSALVLCMSLMGLMFFLLLQKDQMQEGAGGEGGETEWTVGWPEGKFPQEEAAARLKEFAGVIYTYDTAERMFYEGAERYLTKEAYQEFAPFCEGEGSTEDGEGELIHMRSELVEAEPYFYFTESGARAILVSRFTLSGRGRGQLTQYLSLALEESGGEWYITSCRVLGTMEQ